MHARGYAAKLYLTFENGMAFEYLPGVTLNNVLCRNPGVYPLVAQMMAKIHKMSYEDEIKSSEEPRAMLWPLLEKLIGLIPETFSIPEKEFKYGSAVLTIVVFLPD